MSDTDTRRRPSGWATGFTVFAVAMMFTSGVFQVLEGIAALVKDDFFVVTDNYAFNVDTTAWGWIHLIIGVLLILIALGILSGATWARVAGVAIAVLSMVSNFMFLPYYPLWAILVIALDIAVIWALSQYSLRDL